MDREKMKIIGVVINMPIDLAIEIVRESGDLAVSEYPAIERLAECIAERLDIEHSENSIEVEPILISEHTEKKLTALTTA
jgi:hypothetical protein